MKCTTYLNFLLLALLPLFFSCAHKTERPANEQAEENSLVTDLSSSTKDGKLPSATLWTIDAGVSKTEFTIKNFGMDVKGTFGGLNGTIFFDDKNLESSNVEGAVDVNTISTGIAKRDEDLQAKKYFDTEKYNRITFKSDKITRSGTGFNASGNLTIKGISKHTDIPFTFEQSGTKGVFKSRFTVNRLDFGVGGSGVVMGKEVNVSLNIAAKKK